MNVFDLVGTFAIKGVEKATGQIASATTEAKADFDKMGKGAKGSASDIEKGMRDAGSSTNEMAGEAQGAAARFRAAMDSIGEGAKKAGSIAAKGVAAIAVAAAGAITGLSALAGESMEYTESSNRLAIAADAVGVSQEKANAAYQSFLGLTGDSDQATEAAQDMLNLAQAGGDIDTWYNIAAGSVARFGDALPVENLIESANETIRTGQIVGSMADAVNWASASTEQWTAALGDHPKAMDAFNAATAEGASAEDAFNAALAACSDEAERSAITQAALNEIYGETGKAYQEANKHIIEARKAEDDLNAATAAAGNALVPFRTRILGFAADLVNSLVPGLEQAGDGLSGMFEGKEGAAEQFSGGVTSALTQLIAKIADMAPTLLQVGVSVISALFMGIVSAIPGLVESLASQLPGLITTMIELLSDLVNQVSAMLPTLLPLIVQAISGMAVAFVNALPTWIQALIGIVMQLVAVLPTLIPQLLQAAVALLLAIVQAVPQIIPPLIAAIPVVIQAVCELLPTLIPLLVEAAIQLFMALVDCLPQIIDALVAAIPTVINAVMAVLPTFIPALMYAAGQLFMAIVRAVPTILGSLLAEIGSLLSQLPGKVRSFAGKMGEAAMQMIQGMVRGIGDAAQWVIDAIGNLCSNVMDTVAHLFGIYSPSRVMRKMFRYVGEGMALGLDDSEDGILSSMRGIVGRATDIARGFSPVLSVGSAAHAISGPASSNTSGNAGLTARGVYEAVNSALERFEGRPIIISVKADDREVARVVRRYAPC